MLSTRIASILFVIACSIHSECVRAAVPGPINARNEKNPERIVAYIAKWGEHYQPFGDGAAKVTAGSIEGGDWEFALVNMRIEDGIEVVTEELKLLAYAERLAALASTDKDRKTAAAYLHRIYANFSEHKIASARDDCWKPAIAHWQERRPDTADVTKKLQSELVDTLDRLERDFIAPRTLYWAQVGGIPTAPQNATRNELNKINQSLIDQMREGAARITAPANGAELDASEDPFGGKE